MFWRVVINGNSEDIPAADLNAVPPQVGELLSIWGWRRSLGRMEAIAHPRGVVDGYADKLRSGSGRGLAPVAGHPVARANESPELLGIQVQQVSRVRVDVAVSCGRRLQVEQPVDAGWLLVPDSFRPKLAASRTHTGVGVNVTLPIYFRARDPPAGTLVTQQEPGRSDRPGSPCRRPLRDTITANHGFNHAGLSINITFSYGIILCCCHKLSSLKWRRKALAQQRFRRPAGPRFCAGFGEGGSLIPWGASHLACWTTAPVAMMPFPRARAASCRGRSPSGRPRSASVPCCCRKSASSPAPGPPAEVLFPV